MKIKYKCVKGFVNKGIVDLKKDFKIKLSNAQITIGKGALAVNQRDDKYYIDFVIYNDNGNILHRKELIYSDIDAMTKSEFVKTFDNDDNDYKNNLSNSLTKLFAYLYNEYFDSKDFKTGNIIDYHYDDAMVFSYINEFSNDEAHSIFEQLLSLMN